MKTLFLEAHVKPHLAVLRALSKDRQTVRHTQDGTVKIYQSSFSQRTQLESGMKTHSMAR